MHDNSMGAAAGRCLLAILGAVLVLLLPHTAAWAMPAGEVNEAPEGVRNAPGIASGAPRFPVGAKIYAEQCASCHDAGIGRAPQAIILNNMTPETIRTALTTGPMREQGSLLSDEEKIQVAQHLTDREFGTSEAPDMAAAMCQGEHARFDVSRPPAFAGWGLDQAGTHSVATQAAGIDRSNVGKLKLKWAFGFPGANRARSQPALAGGAVFVGSHGGGVYALDRETGCIRWKFDASAEVRSGLVVSPWQAGDAAAQPLVYFGDWSGTAYAVKAFTGELVWKVKVDTHPAALITAAPVLFEDTLYVPVSSLEEGSAASPAYTCCTFRGSVLALDAATGKEKWRKYLVDEPVLQKEGGLYGPSGVPVWAGMALDTERRRLYIATGDNYTQPATELSDSIVALDLANGDIAWHYQALEGDAWNVACLTPTPDNCPEDAGPDFDFGAGVALAKASDGREYVLAGQKSGIAYAIDADTGKLAWERKLGRGGMAGGVHFGIAAVDGRVVVPISDMADGQPSDFPLSPGMNLVDIASGKVVWSTPAPQVCTETKMCKPGYSGAVTATPELIFAGSDDAHLRVYDTATGALVWDYMMDRSFETTNGVPAKGGAISGGAAPIVDGGQLFVPSGYGFVAKIPGNVMAVFEVAP